MRYDLVVIGSGPAGQKGAIAAAKLNKRVAMVERCELGPGGVCVHSGTIPSKTMREAILHLTGFRQRDVFGERYRDKRKITMHDLKRQIVHVVEHELDVIHDQLDRNGVDLFRMPSAVCGAARNCCREPRRIGAARSRSGARGLRHQTGAAGEYSIRRDTRLRFR